jgi:hypothetical protein
MNVSWLTDFPEPGEGSPGLLNSYVYVFNGSSILRHIVTEVGEVNHFPYCLVLQYDGINTLISNSHLCEISSSHGGEYDVQSCLLGCTRQYNPEDSSEQFSSCVWKYKKEFSGEMFSQKLFSTELETKRNKQDGEEKRRQVCFLLGQLGVSTFRERERGGAETQTTAHERAVVDLKPPPPKVHGKMSWWTGCEWPRRLKRHRHCRMYSFLFTNIKFDFVRLALWFFKDPLTTLLFLIFTD